MNFCLGLFAFLSLYFSFFKNKLQLNTFQTVNTTQSIEPCLLSIAEESASAFSECDATILVKDGASVVPAVERDATSKASGCGSLKRFAASAVDARQVLMVHVIATHTAK